MQLAPLVLFALSSLAVAQNTCTATVAAPGCGATLGVTFTPVGGAGNHTIEVSCSGLDPNGIGLMVWGQTQTFVPLPNCPMLVEFQWGHLVNLDATGSHSWSRSWPHWANGYYFIQFASVVLHQTGGFTVFTTDLMRAECN
jgi:hypothetical protein